MSAEFMVGLPTVYPGPILERIRKMGLPVLISANAMPIARWTKQQSWERREFIGFEATNLSHLNGLEVCLDSAGYVAMKRYRSFPWTVRQYVELAASHPFRWFAAMDKCVERDIARNRDEVLDRISGTLNLYRECRREAERHGISDRLMPVLQGWTSDDYLRCLDRMPANPLGVMGVGSMCRREVAGSEGIVATLDAIDRALGPDPVRLHLFGVKTQGAEAVRGHPRIASFDSQAYGSEARDKAFKANGALKKAGSTVTFSKSNAFVADIMEGWVEKQSVRLAKPDWSFQTSLGLSEPAPKPSGCHDRIIAKIRERLRELVEERQLEHDDVSCHLETWFGQWDHDRSDEENLGYP
jgi:hypothetical protein